MAATMNGAALTMTGLWQAEDISSCDEAAMGKKREAADIGKRPAADCFLSSEGTLRKGERTNEMDDGAGAVQVRKRSKRSSSVQLMEVVFDPNTPPAKDLTRKLSSSKVLQPANDVRRSSLSSVPTSSDQLGRSLAVGFDVLPWELKLQVLQHLSAPDLCRLSQVRSDAVSINCQTVLL